MGAGLTISDWMCSPALAALCTHARVFKEVQRQPMHCPTPLIMLQDPCLRGTAYVWSTFASNKCGLLTKLLSSQVSPVVYHPSQEGSKGHEGNKQQV